MVQFSKEFNKNVFKYSLRNMRMENLANENVQCVSSRQLF